MEPMKHTVELEGLAEGWKGHVVMEAPIHFERLEVISAAGFHKFRDVTKGAKKEKLEALFEEQIPALIKIYRENARKLVREVNIVGPNGAAIKSLDEFDRHYATEQCFAEIAAAYLHGFGPVKK